MNKDVLKGDGIIACLKPIFSFCIRFVFILGWISTMLILIVLFYLVFAPIGIVMRLFRVDLLDRKINRSRNSCWRIKEQKDFRQQDYERQS
ncbi:MAG: hypothetical protein HY761_01455 [Candidatus Omnitrophica bacterium]|nr:hypothetical protein [Candidatus Omnitrophota bacterium]